MFSSYDLLSRKQVKQHDAIQIPSGIAAENVLMELQNKQQHKRVHGKANGKLICTSISQRDDTLNVKLVFYVLFLHLPPTLIND